MDIVSQIGGQLLQWRAEGGGRGEWQGTQFKAEADRRAHVALVNALTALAPGVAVLSEEDESSRESLRPEQYFLIDPIDGTASYAHGFPGFVTQVALIKAGHPVLAAVRAPVLELTWSAEVGGGAFVGDRRLQVRRPVGRIVVIDNYPSPRGAAELMMRGLPGTAYVECGSIALKACRVADGTADVFVKDVVVRDWDVAPADLILSEAGGYLRDVHGQAYRYNEPPEKAGLIAAADTELATRVLDLLAARPTDAGNL